MQLGFVSAILHDLDLEHVLQLASDEHFDCVELMCWPPGRPDRKYAGVSHLDAGSLTRAEADRINQLARSLGVALSALGYYPNPLDPDETAANRAAEHLKRVIDTAALLGLPTVNTFIGADHRRDLEHNLDRFERIWPPLVQHAENRDVRIAIENCPMLFTADEWPAGKNLARSPAVWQRMFDAIPSDHFGLNYDPSHLVWQQMDPLAPLRRFRHKLFHVHAKDARIDRDALNEHGILAAPLQYHQPRIPGFGEIDWPAFLGTLRETSYDGPVCIEVEDPTFGKTLEGRVRALRTARNVLAPFFP